MKTKISSAITVRVKVLSLFLLMILGTTACTKYNYVEVPGPIAHHDKTMWEYMSTDDYNWSLTQELIERAGLRDLFEGKSTYGSNITFFGITNHSIRRYLYNNGLEQVSDLPVEQCREWILTSVYPNAAKLDVWKEGAKLPNEVVGKGGEICTMLSGKKLWIYVYREPYNGVIGMGPKRINLVSIDRSASTQVVSHNISTNTGIVHALSYQFTLNDF